MTKILRWKYLRRGADLSDGCRLIDLDQKRDVQMIGQKAGQLQWLADHSEHVPDSYILTTNIYREYLRKPDVIMQAVSASISETLDPNKRYVVRSSSTLEDQARKSYAGQFTSVINLQGVQAIASAVREVFESARSVNVESYRQQIGDEQQDLQMAVLIQEMITPVVSGVSVSRNPLTGLNEIMVEAVKGSGDALVQGGATPDHWVHKWGRFIQAPKNPLLPEQLVETIVRQTRELGDAFGAPVDLEWVYDGQDVYWVQIRPLTGLDSIDIYSNTISKEQLPGLIKPLIWSVNIPLVNSAWIQIFEELIGPTGLKPEQLAKSFYYRAYFNMGTVGSIFELLGFPRDSLELLMGFEKSAGMPAYRPTFRTLRFLPRVIAFMLALPAYPRRLDRDLAELQEAYRSFRKIDLDTLDEPELIEAYEWLFTKNLKAARHNILVPLIMGVYNGMLAKQLRTHGIDPLEFDTTEDLVELNELDPKRKIEKLNRLYRDLSSDEQERLQVNKFEEIEWTAPMFEFRVGFEKFLESFGHFGESGNDFSSTPWRENPLQVLDMIRTFTVQEEKEKIGWDDLQINPWASTITRLLGRRARSYILARERVSSFYTLGYGLFRELFLALGDRFVGRKFLDHQEDVFYLSLDEIRDIINGEKPTEGLWGLVDQRKKEMELSRSVILPDTFYGEEVPPLEALSGELSALHGMPTSRGYHEGKVTVIESLNEAGKLKKGDVLVVPYSDVAWTPLFGLAGAVIAQSGGVLSHSSIVARELGIPCVVSVPNACQLKDGTIVVVDGHRGEITIKEPRV